MTAKKFLFLAAGSVVGFGVSVLLHNFFYAAEILSRNLLILPQIFSLLHVLFFLIAVLICPIGVVVGLVGSVVLWLRKVVRKDASFGDKKT